MAATQSWTFCWNVAGLIVLKTGGGVFFSLKSDNSRELVKFLLYSLQAAGVELCSVFTQGFFKTSLVSVQNLDNDII